MLVLGEEFRIVFDFGFVVGDGLEIAVFGHAIEGFWVVFDVVNKEDAVEMVDFVHEDAREEAVGFEADFLAIFELGFDFGLVGATNETVDFGDREAAFVIFGDFAFGADNFGVDEGGKRVVFLIVEVVADDDNAFIDAELRGGHSGRKFVGVFLFPGERGIDHIGNNLASFVVDFADARGFGAQTGVGSSNNRFHN